MLDKIRGALGGEVSGKTVGLLGLTFKPNTDDLRESPALVILDGLLEQGARVRVFDPVALPLLDLESRPGVEVCEDEYDVARGADGLVLATEWNQFRSLNLDRLKQAMARPVMIDLRNVYEPEMMRREGFEYTGVGR
jgi:UDPglucose 6-dehydrogenase